MSLAMNPAAPTPVLDLIRNGDLLDPATNRLRPDWQSKIESLIQSSNLVVHGKDEKPDMKILELITLDRVSDFPTPPPVKLLDLPSSVSVESFSLL